MLAPQAAVQRLLIPMHFVLQSKADRWTTRQASQREFVADDGDVILIDPSTPLVALYVAGMEVDGTPEAALDLFMKAWDARTDDYDTSIAAHFIARGIKGLERRLPALGAWIARNSIAQGRIV